MRIFLFLSLSLITFGCSTVEVTKEVIRVTNTVTNKVKGSIPQNEDEEQEILEDIIDKENIEEEIEIIEEKQKEEKNIVESQQKLAEINFIGNTENKIINILGEPTLKRIDGSILTMRYDSENCRLFLFFNQKENNKRVEYFELRNTKTQLLNSKQSLELCYRELKLLS